LSRLLGHLRKVVIKAMCGGVGGVWLWGGRQWGEALVQRRSFQLTPSQVLLHLGVDIPGFGLLSGGNKVIRERWLHSNVSGGLGLRSRGGSPSNVVNQLKKRHTTQVSR